MQKNNLLNISVVITMYNAKNIINDTIDAVKKQTYRVEEIIVVDDCSTDESCSFVKIRHPEVKLIQTEKNSGPGAARNLGKNQAQNNFVLFIDHDVVLDKKTIHRLMIANENFPLFSIFIPKVLYFHDPEVIQNEGNNIHYLGLTFAINQDKPLKESSNTDCNEIFAFGSGCYLIDYNRCNKIIYYDESFFYGLEDADYSLHNARCGNKALYVSSAQVFHRLGSTSGLSYSMDSPLFSISNIKYPGKKLELLARNRLILIFKHYNVTFLLTLLPLSLLFDIFLFLYGFFRSDDRLSVYRGHKSFCLRFKSIIHDRKKMRACPFNKDIRNKLGLEPIMLRRSNRSVFATTAFRLINKLLLCYGRYILRIQSP